MIVKCPTGVEYEHGAWELFHAVEHLLPVSARDAARVDSAGPEEVARGQNSRQDRTASDTSVTMSVAPPTLSIP
jgi:hypothetical protein